MYWINKKNRIKHEPSEMNQYFSNLASNLTNKEDIQNSYGILANNLPTQKSCQSFHIRNTYYTEVCKIIARLGNDYFIRHDDSAHH